MNCDREAEVWRAIEARHWPDRCDEELRAHAAACESCADLTEVASVLVDEREETVRAAHIPSSGVVWFRAQLRVRQEAARTVRRTISGLQAAAVFVAVASVALIVRAYGGFDWISVPEVHFTLPVILMLAAPLLLAPAAIYFAVSKD